LQVHRGVPSAVTFRFLHLDSNGITAGISIVLYTYCIQNYSYKCIGSYYSEISY
jgi:hypothetical protein